MIQANRFDPTKITNTGVVKLFRRFDVRDRDQHALADALADGRVRPDDDLFLLHDADDAPARAVTLRHLAYHHLVQGHLDGRPFLMTFCPVCNSGMSFDPTVDGRELRFNTAGVYHGMVLIADEATGSFWDHITGRALSGAHEGKQLEILGAHSVQRAATAAKTHPQLRVALPPLKRWQRLVTWLLSKNTFRTRPDGQLPPGFRASLGKPDARRPELELGLGVWHGREARFYPIDDLRRADPLSDTLGGLELTITLDPDTGVPAAAASDGEPVHAVFSRWYGFSMTFPGCDVYSDANARSTGALDADVESDADFARLRRAR